MPAALAGVYDLLDRGLVNLFAVHIGDAKLDAHVVGADEDAVNAGDLQDGVQVVDGGDAFDTDDGDVVPVAVFQILPGFIADVFAAVHDAGDSLAFEGTPLGSSDHTLDLLDGFAVGGPGRPGRRRQGP